MPAAIQEFCEIQKPVKYRKIGPLENPCESSMKNTIGKPCAGKLHAGFEVGDIIILNLITWQLNINSGSRLYSQP
ncbi:hypothetical protein [Leeuwenhoekiella marinoflava]|uniref:hypothetical protein n=1 Tax=Leeuwenhoekiella marinoflava TaxID=988 RepID=UPI0030030210